jgi:MerR family transcriptional regulator, copper efflux regulator
MNIGQAASATGVSAKMIRWYEQQGLIPQATRSDSNYRHYTETDLHRLRFIRRARDLGFSIRQISELLALWNDRGRASSDVKALAVAHAAALRGRITELEGMVSSIDHLAESCQGDARPDCPILEDLGARKSA